MMPVKYDICISIVVVSGVDIGKKHVISEVTGRPKI